MTDRDTFNDRNDRDEQYSSIFSDEFAATDQFEEPEFFGAASRDREPQDRDPQEREQSSLLSFGGGGLFGDPVTEAAEREREPVRRSESNGRFVGDVVETDIRRGPDGKFETR